MKYEVPEINISKFSVENIVTLSAAQTAYDAVSAALGDGTTFKNVSANPQLNKTTMDQWVNGN